MIEIAKYRSRSFAVREDGELLTVCLYRKGAVAVKDRVEALQASIQKLETKCAAMREPLVWEEYLGSPRFKGSAAACEAASPEGVGRASERGVDQESRHRTRPSEGRPAGKEDDR